MKYILALLLLLSLSGAEAQTDSTFQEEHYCFVGRCGFGNYQGNLSIRLEFSYGKDTVMVMTQEDRRLKLKLHTLSADTGKSVLYQAQEMEHGNTARVLLYFTKGSLEMVVFITKEVSRALYVTDPETLML